MEYIVVDTSNSIYNISINEDGETLIFDNLKEAQEEADNCQEGIVIPLTNIIGLLTKCKEGISMLCDSDEEAIEGISDITKELDDILNLS